MNYTLSKTKRKLYAAVFMVCLSGYGLFTLYTHNHQWVPQKKAVYVADNLNPLQIKMRDVLLSKRRKPKVFIEVGGPGMHYCAADISTDCTSNAPEWWSITEKKLQLTKREKTSVAHNALVVAPKWISLYDANMTHITIGEHNGFPILIWVGLVFGLLGFIFSFRSIIFFGLLQSIVLCLLLNPTHAIYPLIFLVYGLAFGLTYSFAYGIKTIYRHYK